MRGVPYETVKERNIFNVFFGGRIQDNAIKTNGNIDLIHGDVRLNEFRSTDSLKKLKRSMQGLEYDYAIIDTAPTYDNIIGNVLPDIRFYLNIPNRNILDHDVHRTAVLSSGPRPYIF
ncbi:hypothetical protein AGMMS49940_20240 [Spirochaetia bacterium]|nr:hypothetical protein AGMMS49940_20240 [Spirochaetia bacterium]